MNTENLWNSFLANIESKLSPNAYELWFKDTYLYDTVKYAPSVIIVDKHSIVDYLDSESDKDYDRYQDTKEFTKWLKEYIKLKRNDG